MLGHYNIKNVLFILFSIFGMSLAATNMNGLHVDGNKIRNINNEIVQLRVCKFLYFNVYQLMNNFVGSK